MTELLTAAQMRAIERAAIGGGAVTGLELMERAGRGVVAAALERWPELATAPGRALVICGPGNNGGDGFVVARILRERGWRVEALLYGDEAKLPPDAARNARRWREAGGAIAPYDDARIAPLLLEGAELVVDALFGVGLTRPLRGFEGLFAAGASATSRAGDRPRVVAVDLPSGLCADSGRPLAGGDAAADAPASLSADLTVSFHRAKRGHYLGQGFRRCGSLAVVGIGLGDAPVEDAVTLIGRPRIEAEAPGLGKTEGNHKYDHGHALVLAGGVGTGGAGRLAARGALRIGAGAVTLGAPPAALIENAAQLNAVMLRPVRDLAAFLARPEAAKMNALCLGPGMGRGPATRAAVAAACRSRRAVVLDADALTSFEGDPAELFAQLHERCVLTPHPGEFGRVFPDLRARLTDPAERGPAYSDLDAARDAAARAGAVVLLKGAATVIAAPSGRAAVSASVYDRAAPWLATAGSGDVLAGFIAGLMARGLPPFAAATTAAWLHVEAARRFGPGLIAEDLPEALPAVFRDLGL